MAPIYEDNVPIVYETKRPTLFSILQESAFNQTWEPWYPRYFALRQNGTLIYRKARDSPIIARLDLSKTEISKLEIDSSGNTLLEKEVGIVVTCLQDGIETSFRCILQEYELHSFVAAVKRVSHDSVIDRESHLLGSLTEAIADSTPYVTQSIMRQSLTESMDRYDLHSKAEKVKLRRGAMHYLPVLFGNDLVHGSWWFALGSISVVIFSAVILANSYHTTVLGTDDSSLSAVRYRAIWWCMVASGVFFTLGSLLFVRAMFKTPPMRPLLGSCYHCSSDELMGSWMFFIGCLPLIPYCFVYLAQERSAFYLGAFIVSIILNIGAYIFVLSCYPNKNGEKRKPYIKPVVKAMCNCCISNAFIEKHLYNDWLAGTWILLWGNVLGLIGFAVLAIVAIWNRKSLQLFIYGTS